MSAVDAKLNDSNRHCIKITNIKSGETLVHSLCLVRGQISAIESGCTRESILLTHLQSKKSRMEDVKSSEWDVAEWGEFKCLTWLNSGPNNFNLSWKCNTCRQNVQITFLIFHQERLTNYKVLPVWITCQKDQDEVNEESTLDNLERVSMMAYLAQCMTSECLMDKGFERTSIFCIERKVAVFQSQLTSSKALSMKHEALWQHIARELMSSDLASHHRKYLAFLSCTCYEAVPFMDGKKRSGRVKGNIALGAGGLALLGTASIHTWPRNLPEVLPKFLDTTPVDTKKYFDDSCRRGTYGGCFATALGSVCHELGHTFDLGHSQIGIMGRGFHHTQKIFTLPSCIEHSTVHKKNCSEKLILQKTSLSDKKQSGSLIPLSHDINISWSQPRMEIHALPLQHKKLRERYKSMGIGKKSLKKEELPFWSNGCATFLAFHRWFNDKDDYNTLDETISYNKQMRCISSKAGLRVVQVRNDADGGAVISSWQFLSSQGRSQFLIPSSCSLLGQNPQVNLSVIAEDSFGNILKERL